MDTSRKANREDNEKTLQYQSRTQSLLAEEMYEGKLTHLLSMMSGLEKSPSEAPEFERRIKLFGACQRAEGELASQFYARLRHWLGRHVPKAKSPLHAPRQTDD